MLDRMDTTIVAVSSAAGFGAVGIVRLSGPDSLRMAEALVVSRDGIPLRGHAGSSIISGELRMDDFTLPVRVNIFHSPRSYTRQDMVEVCTIGSPAALETVYVAALALGACPARPGEFTARAFFNGNLDLVSAEAVARLVRARTDTQLRAARRIMDGSLAKKIGEVRQDLIELLALVEADIDFAEEPIEFISPSELRFRLNSMESALHALVANARSAERLSVLPHILLLGPPNAGKSTLINQMSGTSRSICAAVAGTTRDVLSVPIRCGQGEAILLDAAGVDESDDDLLARARTMTIVTAEQVDLVCVVVDLASTTATSEGSDEKDDAAQAARSLLRLIPSGSSPAIIIAANKCDLLSPDRLERAIGRLRAATRHSVYPVSALCGDGIEELRDAFARELDPHDTTVSGEAFALSEHQFEAVREAMSFLARAAALAESANETSDRAELVAFEVREALDRLGLLTGNVTTEDLLATVFANFCIGK